MLEEIKKEYALHIEVINSLPINNLKNKKQYILEVDKLIKNYEEKAKKIYEEIDSRLGSYFELKPTDYSEKENNLNSFALVLKRTNNLSTAYEKLKIDKIVYLISDYGSNDFEQINSKIFSFINIFKTCGIILTEKDFNLTNYVYEYMEVFFKYQNDLTNDELKKSFENIYWKCSNIVLELELNMRYLFYKNEKFLNKYIQRTNSVLLKQFKDGENSIIDDYAYLRKKLDEIKFNDKNDLTYKFVSDEFSINNYTNDKVNKIIDDLTIEKRDDLILVLIKLQNTLKEYKCVLKYHDLTNKMKNLYNENLEKNFMQVRLKKLRKLESKLFKLNKKAFNSLKKTKVNKFELEVDNVIREIKTIYDEIDENIFKVIIKEHLASNSTIFKALLLVCQYYSVFARNIGTKEEKNVNKELEDLYYFILNPNNNLINNITLLEDKDLALVIANNYRMFGINLTKEMLENNLDGLINNIDTVIINYRLGKLNISISDLQNLEEFKKIKLSK